MIYLKSNIQTSRLLKAPEILNILLEYYDSKDGISDESVSKHVHDIVSIIEITIVSGGESSANDIANVIGTLFSKPSATIQINLLMMLKRLINHNTADNFGVSPLVYAKILIDASGLELLLYLISSSSTEIRANCVSIISSLYNLPFKSVQLPNQKDVFIFVSSIILPPRKRLSLQFKP